MTGFELLAIDFQKYAVLKSFYITLSSCSNCCFNHVICRIFRAIDIAFSMNGVDFPDTYSTSVGFKIPTVSGAQSRYVNVPLNHTVARAMRVTFHANAPQILISEITFENGMSVVVLVHSRTW